MIRNWIWTDEIDQWINRRRTSQQRDIISRISREDIISLFTLAFNHTNDECASKAWFGNNNKYDGINLVTGDRPGLNLVAIYYLDDYPRRDGNIQSVNSYVVRLLINRNIKIKNTICQTSNLYPDLYLFELHLNNINQINILINQQSKYIWESYRMASGLVSVKESKDRSSTKRLLSSFWNIS